MWHRKSRSTPTWQAQLTWSSSLQRTPLSTEIDHRPEPGGVCLGESDRLAPVENRPVALIDLGWSDPVARVGKEAVLLDRRLEYASQGAIVAVD